MKEGKNLLTYPDLLFAGIANIVGAGIFALIGYVYSYSKKKTWLSIVLAGLFISYVSGIYSTLPKKIPITDTFEFDIVKMRFGTSVSHMVIIGVVFSGIFASYVVATSFGHYFQDLTGLSHKLATIIILVLCYILNISNITTLASVNNAITISGLGIFIFLISFGLYVMYSDTHKLNLIDYFLFRDYQDFKTNISNILKGAYLILFSYFGFEVLVKLHKDSVNPNQDIPAAINNSMIIVIILYTLLGFVYSYSRQLLHKGRLLEGHDSTPLISMMERLTHTTKYNKMISVMACTFTSNTILLSIMGSSRLLDDEIHIDGDSRVPQNSVLIVTIGIFLLYLFKAGIKLSAYIANTLSVVLFVCVVIGANSLKT